MTDPHLRMSDAEREQAAGELAEHYAQGRLTAEEHSERLDQIWAARTYAELAPVFSDLPSGHGRPGRSRGSVGAPRGTTPGTTTTRRVTPRFPGWVFALLALLVVATVITKLPWILFGLAMWWVFFARSRCGTPRRF